MRDFHARLGEAGQPDDIIGQYGGNRNTNGLEMLKVLEDNEMKAMNGRMQKSEAKWIWARNCKDERTLRS